MTLFTVSTFQRPDKTTGKLMRLELKDETGQIRVSVWNEKVDELANIRLGANLQVMNARVKQGLDKKLELHVETSSQMSLLAEEWMKTPIAKLQASMGSVTIIGTVISKPFFREVTTSKGEKVGLTTFELQDATGKIWVSAWRKHAEITQNLAVGEEIEIKDGYVKKGFSDQLEVSTRATTSIQILSKQEEGY